MKRIDLSSADLGYAGLVRYRSELRNLVGKRKAVELLRHKLRGTKKMDDPGFEFPDLTIGITAFNRPIYLESCLHYIVEYFPGATVIIADASSSENKAFHQATIAKLSANCRNVVFRFKAFDEDAPHLEPVLYIAEETKTEFFVKWDDDDFYNPLALREAISTMGNDESIVSMTGPSVNLTTEGSDKIIVTGHATTSIKDWNIIERLIFLGLTATQCWNNLFRTEAFRQSVESIMYLKRTDLDQLWDHALTVEIALRGRSEKTETLFMARRAGGNRTSENKMFRGRDLLYKLIDPNRSGDYTLFRQKVGESLRRTFGPGNEDTAREALDEVCKSLIMASCGNELLYRNVSRDFLTTHTENEAWFQIAQKNSQALAFINTAVSVVDETD